MLLVMRAQRIKLIIPPKVSSREPLFDKSATSSISSGLTAICAESEVKVKY